MRGEFLLSSKMINYSRGNHIEALTFNPNQISFALKTILNKPGETDMKVDVQYQFQLYFFITILILLLLSISARAQINAGCRLDNVEISLVVSKLQDKVLLNESQVTIVKQVLQKYSAEITSLNNPAQKSNSKNEKQNLVNDTNQQIKSILDNRQKMKFDIIEKEWWALVKHEEKD